MPPINAWEISYLDNDGSVRTNLEKWAELAIEKANTEWQTASSKIGFQRVDLYRGIVKPNSQGFSLETMLEWSQEPVCWLSTWGSSSRQHSEIDPDWLVELHCLIAIKLPDAASAKVRTGTSEKAGLNQLIELVRDALINPRSSVSSDGSTPEEQHYDGDGLADGQFRTIGNDGRTLVVNRLHRNPREAPIGFVRGMAAVDLIFTAEIVPGPT